MNLLPQSFGDLEGNTRAGVITAWQVFWCWSVDVKRGQGGFRNTVSRVYLGHWRRKCVGCGAVWVLDQVKSMQEGLVLQY